MNTIANLLEKTRQFIAGRLRPLDSTYRLQFHAAFTFRDAERITPYLHELGITHAYASPYLKARPGSTHGYDIVDHGSLNPEIGGEDAHTAWVHSLHTVGMGHILDMVPNHAGVATNDNGWWNDVLENGPSSRYAGYFDIAWRGSHRAEMEDKVLLPTLGEPYGDVLEAGQLKLAFENGAFAIHYFDRHFPVSPSSFAGILSHNLEALEGSLGGDDPALQEYRSILTACRNLPSQSECDPAKILERAREKDVIKRRLVILATDSAEVRAFIERNLSVFNGEPGNASSFDRLDSLLDAQCYRLAYWRVAPDEINYRRFFDINDLAALSIEREDVFAASHALVMKLLAEGRVDGLRIDHPDGFYDPQQYFARLQNAYMLQCARIVAASDEEFRSIDAKDLEEILLSQGEVEPTRLPESGRWPLYVVAEKILGAKESLPDTWTVDGTSGYEFLTMTNGLFVDPDGEGPLTRLYQDWVHDHTRYSELIYKNKLLVLQVSLASELHMLVDQLDRLAQKSRRSRDFTFNTLRKALREVIACFPVYRSYIAGEVVNDVDRRHIETAIRRARVRNPLLSRHVFRFIRDMLLLEFPESFTEADRLEQRRFAGKFQQVTAPVTAKGVEDTSFYIFNRLTSLNEVGGEPDRFGITPEALHAFYSDRQAKWPFALSPLTTHDTKRSEDVRARINVLSEIPGEWKAALQRWSELNAGHRPTIDDATAPDSNEEYFLYQTLLGAWPLEPYSSEEYRIFVQRIQAYAEKALHEAKIHTSWINPNAEYDAAVRDFVARILDPETSGPFLTDFRNFQKKISQYGMLNSLSQTLLKLCAPGVPDTYQGTELWDFSLVDPDNRRPVDYEMRRQFLSKWSPPNVDRSALTRDLIDSMQDGRVKLYVTATTLNYRREHLELFTGGGYVPLQAAGAKANHLFAFAREAANQCILVAVPRLTTQLAPDLPLRSEHWQDTRLVLPQPEIRWRNLFTGEVVNASSQSGQNQLAASEIFRQFPIALLIRESS